MYVVCPWLNEADDEQSKVRQISQEGQFSHAAMITQLYEQFWHKPIPHDWLNLILNQLSLNDRKWLICFGVREYAYDIVFCTLLLHGTRLQI